LAALAALPVIAEAQPAGKVPRVAYLNATSAASATWAVEPFRQGLRELGYIEGQNILIEYRWADGRFARRKTSMAHSPHKSNGLPALLVIADPLVNENRGRIVGFAATNRLPAIYPYRTFVDAGGLMSYGVDSSDLSRRAATYVDRILKGAKPAELPIEQPAKFELVVNLKTAKSLALAIAPSLLLRADHVIE
ncbi:MAG: hypothetical protein MUF54_26165, partial [Polyangiaceae bacterium]|nr:hypothetical protein [Polyangiaceae bacterium]